MSKSLLDKVEAARAEYKHATDAFVKCFAGFDVAWPLWNAAQGLIAEAIFAAEVEAKKKTRKRHETRKP